MAFLLFLSGSAAKGAVEVGLDRREAGHELAGVGYRRAAPGPLHEEQRPERRGERDTAHKRRMVRQHPEPGRAAIGPEDRGDPGGRRGQRREEEEERHEEDRAREEPEARPRRR
jgi:hypothetical protein